MTLVYRNTQEGSAKEANLHSYPHSSKHQENAAPVKQTHKKLAMSVNRDDDLFYAILSQGTDIIEKSKGFESAAEASLAGFKLFELFTKESNRTKLFEASQAPILWQ